MKEGVYWELCTVHPVHAEERFSTWAGSFEGYFVFAEFVCLQFSSLLNHSCPIILLFHMHKRFKQMPYRRIEMPRFGRRGDNIHRRNNNFSNLVQVPPLYFHMVKVL